MLSFWRVVKFAFQDMGRNAGLTFLTVFILTLMLLSVNVLWAVDVLTKQAVQAVKDQINVSLFFVPEAGAANINEIKNYLQSFPAVTELTLIEPAAVLESFKQRHEGNEEILTALDELGENPFGPTMVIKAADPADYKKIMEAIDVPEYDFLIEAKSFDGQEGAIEKLQNIVSRVERVGFGLSLLFAVIAFLIIFNTVRVAINTQRTEISIKRLVGASNWFIRGPYLVESVIFTALSVALGAGIVYLALRWLDPYVAVVFPSGFSLTNYYNSHIISLFGLQALCVLLLTIVSSGLAMRRQLKV